MSNTTVVVDGEPILNPFDPLVFLSPEQASQVRISRYVLVGTLGAFLWDIISNFKSDYILSRHRIRLQTTIYFISKVFSLAYVLGSTIFETAPISSCSSSEHALEVLFCIAIPSTSLLIFFRARAVFSTNPWAVALFGALWFAVLAGCVGTFFGITASNIGPTKYCVNGNAKPHLGAAATISLINDTIVFLSITWRLWGNSYAGRTMKDGIRVLVFGEYLPAFSRSMLQDGQAYYLAAVCVNLMTVITLCILSSSDIYRTMLMIPNVALMNMMACRVYRNTLFALLHNSSRIPSVMGRDLNADISLSLSGKRDSGMNQGVNTTSNTTQTETPNDVDVITVTRTIQPIIEDYPADNKDKDRTDISRMV
ncbi:hypothetical protein BYT27DRAFT_7186374 [Phlegmacium glaucopus]|nr:hypothetical protein BYT27DRAFT_7186374 [Phlegmacium glaucopus]